MASTQAQLSTAVLQQMAMIGSTATPTAADAALIEGTYTKKLAEWRRKGLVWWPATDRSTSEIPDEVFSVLVDLIENEVSTSFGKELPAVQKKAIEMELLRGLRAMNHKPPSGEATPFSSY